jgi:hypothetical protein
MTGVVPSNLVYLRVAIHGGADLRCLPASYGDTQ